MRHFIVLATVAAFAGCSEKDSERTPVVPAVVFASPNAKVFWPAPGAGGVDIADLVDVQLSGLVEAPAGGFLRGFHLETYNCCKRYTCADGSSECDDPERACAADDDANAIASVIPLALPTDSLPSELGKFFSGDTVYIETVWCTEKPRLTSTASGWLDVPVDSTRVENEADGLASETDAFAEVQIYHATQTFFEHVRSVLDDPTFCLGQNSMHCEADGTAVLDGALPEHPFHITANTLFPEVNMTALGGQLAPAPFGQGRGRTADDPVLIEDFQRLGNAAFVPALEGGPIEVPPEMAPLVEQFNRPYDSNIYFQGDRDFGYDGDVVFHEFTHGIVHTFKPGFHSLGRDHWGSHAEPGSMNEGWSDYFAASFIGDSVTGEYAGGGMRDAANTDTCPESIIGEVHQDSLPWSGALWDIRIAVETSLGADGVKALDQLLLAAIAEADDDEDMARQSDRIVALLQADATLSGFESDAVTAFADHSVSGCERVRDLSTVEGTVVTSYAVDNLQQPSPGGIGVANMSPSVVQLRVQVPPGSPGFDLSWAQAAGGMGGMGGGTATLLSVLVHEGEPIDWQYGVSGTTAVPHDQLDNVIAFDASDPLNQATLQEPDANGNSAADFAVALTEVCSVRTFYISLISTTDAASIGNIQVVVQPDNIGC